jgi:predicted outer membrane repeat protein
MNMNRWTKPLALLLAALLTASLTLSLLPTQPTRAATVIYVSQSGSDDPECGLTWDGACSLQAALARALPGDELWVAAGLYVPGESGDRSATFRVPAGVALYGGFTGSETARDQRDATAHLTILSGDIDRNDIAPNDDGIAQSWADLRGANAYHVVTLDTTTPVGASTIINGFVITAGQADGPAPDDRGGGLLCPYALDRADCSPTLSNLVFSGNSARYGGGMFTQAVGDAVNRPVLSYATFRGNRATMDGGGLYSQNGSYPVLTEVIFEGNRADRGGGLYSGTNRSLAAITLSRVDFRENQAESAGGAVYLFAAVAGHTASFTEVTFFGNRADYGGGLFSDGRRGDIDVTLSKVTFEDNHATVDGGGMANDTADGGSTLSRLTDVTFTRNRADGSGGALAGRAGIGIADHQISRLIVAGNHAGDDGGGFHCTSEAQGRCDATLGNTLFSGNLAGGDGGAISLHAAEDGSAVARLANATFGGNEAQQGGAIASWTEGDGISRAELVNSILWSNSASTGAEIAFNTLNAAPVLRYTLVEGWTNDAPNHVWGDRDPLFVAPAGAAAPTTLGDYRLQPTSPAIDAGDNHGVPSGVATDLNGGPRFVDVPSVPDTGNGTAPIVDMGAYEHGATTNSQLQLRRIYLPVVTGKSGGALTFATRRNP